MVIHPRGCYTGEMAGVVIQVRWLGGYTGEMAGVVIQMRWLGGHTSPGWLYR